MLITRGQEENTVLVGFRLKVEALQALDGVEGDEDFPQLKVAPGSKI